MVCIQCNGKGYVTDRDQVDRVCRDCGGRGEDPSTPRNDHYLRKTPMQENSEIFPHRGD